MSLEQHRRRLQRAVHRDADQFTDRLAAMATGSKELGTIVSVTAGVAQDGNAVVTVSWRGGTCTAAGWNVSQTLVAGQRVMCDLTADHQLFVAYVIVGAP